MDIINIRCVVDHNPLDNFYAIKLIFHGQTIFHSSGVGSALEAELRLKEVADAVLLALDIETDLIESSQ